MHSVSQRHTGDERPPHFRQSIRHPILPILIQAMNFGNNRGRFNPRPSYRIAGNVSAVTERKRIVRNVDTVLPKGWKQKKGTLVARRGEKVGDIPHGRETPTRGLPNLNSSSSYNIFREATMEICKGELSLKFEGLSSRARNCKAFTAIETTLD